MRYERTCRRSESRSRRVRCRAVARAERSARSIFAILTATSSRSPNTFRKAPENLRDGEDGEEVIRERLATAIPQARDDLSRPARCGTDSQRRSRYISRARQGVRVFFERPPWRWHRLRLREVG